MSRYLETVIRQARGGAAELRLRPRSRFEGVVPGFEIEEPPASELADGSALATAPRRIEPSPPERATNDASFAASAPAPDAPVASGSAAAVVRETVQSVQRSEHTLRSERIAERRETLVRDHTVERHRERIETAAPHRRAEPVAAPLVASVAPPRAIATEIRERATAAASASPPPRSSREVLRRPAPPAAGPPPGIELRYEAARDPEITVVIGRLEVQMVREPSTDSAGSRPGAAIGSPAASATAPALSDYLRTRTAK